MNTKLFAETNEEFYKVMRQLDSCCFPLDEPDLHPKIHCCAPQVHKSFYFERLSIALQIIQLQLYLG